MICVTLWFGCGNDGDGAMLDDNGIGANRVLYILEGSSHGLAYHMRKELKVRYTTDRGAGIGDAVVHFALVADGPDEDVADAILSEAVATTDANGNAQVDLITGEQEGRFRVSVDALDAPTAFFSISVAEGGFTQLRITPTHVGWRPAEDFVRVAVRLYDREMLTCSTVDLNNLPEVFPQFELNGFGDAVEYQNTVAGREYTIVAWAEVADTSTPVVSGCLELLSSQIQAGPVQIKLPLTDRELRLPAESTLTSQFDLTPVADTLSQLGTARAWDTLACPAGPGQLLLDCVLGVLDGNSDCEAAEPEDEFVRQIAELRGPVGEDGCRSAEVGGQPTLDQRLTEAVEANKAWPQRVQLEALLAARADTLSMFELDSLLSAVATTAMGHGLLAVRVPVGESVFEIELPNTSRPVIEQPLVPVDIKSDNRLMFAGHSFTLRYGDIAALAFAEHGLVTAGLAPDLDAVGTALMTAVGDSDAEDDGCAAMGALICAALPEVSGSQCAEFFSSASCDASISALDNALGAWANAMGSSELDLNLSGSGVLGDADGDLVVDSFVGEEADSAGEWDARLTLADDVEISFTGKFRYAGQNETASP